MLLFNIVVTGFFRVLAIIDYYLEKVVGVFFKKKWKIAGSCKKDGRCCRDIGIIAEKWIINNKYLLKLVTWWYTKVHPFYFKYYVENEDALIFGCTKLNDNGSCSIYKKRPPICRKYPVVNYFKKPVLFEGCGFKAEMNS